MKSEVMRANLRRPYKNVGPLQVLLHFNNILSRSYGFDL